MTHIRTDVAPGLATNPDGSAVHEAEFNASEEVAGNVPHRTRLLAAESA